LLARGHYEVGQLGFAGRVILNRWRPLRPGFEPRSGHVGFMVDEVAFGQVFSEYFGFSYQFSFHRILHIHNDPWMVQ
jgi:hypothetical protein